MLSLLNYSCYVDYVVCHEDITLLASLKKAVLTSAADDNGKEFASRKEAFYRINYIQS